MRGEKQPKRTWLVGRHIASSLDRVETQADDLERQNFRRRAESNWRHPFQEIRKIGRLPKLLSTRWRDKR